MLLGLLAVLIAAQGPVRFEIELRRNVSAPELSEAFIDGIMELSDRRFERAIRGLWHSGRLPHRRAALTFIGFKMTRLRDAGFGPFAGYVREALDDPDSSLREIALNLLVRVEPERCVPRLLGHLEDADHHLRVVVLRHLRNLGQTNALPAVARQLEERNPKLVCEAVNWLQRVTGIDHGMNSRWISRRPGLSPEERAENRARFERAHAAARAWWAGQKDRWKPVGVIDRPRDVRGPSLRLETFGLKRTDGSPFDLSAFEGRPVLIYFFTTWKSAAATEARDVRRVSAAAGNDFAVLGVALDAVADEHNENQLSIIFEKDEAGHDHGHDHDHHGHGREGEYTMPYAREAIVAETEKKLKQLGFRFPVAYDFDGRLMLALDGGEVPAFAFLDADHRLVRRFAGPRRAECLWSVIGLERPLPPEEGLE